MSVYPCKSESPDPSIIPTDEVHIIACGWTIHRMLFNSTIKRSSLQIVEKCHNCVHYYKYFTETDTFDKSLFPVLIDIRNVYIIKPHTPTFISSTARLGYHLMRNRSKIRSTTFFYMYLRRVLKKDIAKMICDKIVYEMHDWPCQMEDDIREFYEREEEKLEKREKKLDD
jgi:hypothetical protein